MQYKNVYDELKKYESKKSWFSIYRVYTLSLKVKKLNARCAKFTNDSKAKNAKYIRNILTY